MVTIATDSFSRKVIRRREVQLLLRRKRQMEYLIESGSVCGNFFIVCLFLQKKDSKQFIYEQLDIE